MTMLREICDSLHRWKRSRTGRPGDPPSGVLLISSGGLGDTILFSLIAPRFAALAADGEAVDVIVQEGSAALQFLYPAPLRLIGLDYRRFIRDPFYRYRMSDRLFARRYRLCVSTDHLRLPTVDDALVAAAAAEKSYALEPRSWAKHDAELAANRRDYTDWVTPSAGMAHRMVRWHELVSALSASPPPLPRVRFPDAVLPAPETRARPFVVFHPFTSEAARQHAPETWAALADALAPDHDVVLSAGPGDLARNPGYDDLAARDDVSLDERGFEAKLGLIRAARLVVAVDTSIMHLAAGAGAPTLCLASAAHVIDSIPYDPRIAPGNVEFLYHDMPCRGCLGACVHPLEGGRFACVDGLAAADAVAKARAMLAEPESGGE
ncbi:MAG: lipopolysaccharide heptosyltransferase family protein [Magnetovibrio sp.]|nr:lipopolysaccharide heptosyltransferase family protein [Magnetovibrio sp.]